MTEPQHLVPPSAVAPAQAPRRFPYAFGRRFFLLLMLGLLWLGPGWSNRRYLAALILWDAAVVGLWIWDLLRLPLPRQLEVRRVWTSSLQLSLQSCVTLALQNSGKTWITAQLFDHIPPRLRSDTSPLEIQVTKGGTATAQRIVCPRERGDAQLGEVSLRYQSAWRLAERWAVAPLGQMVRVYPSLEESKRDSIYLIRSRQIVLEKRLKIQPGQGREFESLREYREGDEGRDICWTATARRAKLISKSYQTERSQTVWLVLDTGRLLRTRVAGLSKLDFSVNAALSLAQVAFYSGDRVAMLSYGRRIQQRLPASRGASHMRALVESLAQTRGEEFEADHLRAAEALLTFQKRRSLIVWLTDLAETAATPDVIESASQLTRRHLVLFALIGQPELTSLLAERPADATAMYRYAAAEEIVQRREVLLGGLRQRGALTLEVQPARLSTALVNHYLAAKERSLI